MRYAELVALQTRRNIGMRFRVHVRVDADADRRTQTQRQRYFAEHVQFGFAFDVEAADARLQRLAHFAARLADARKNDLGGLTACGQHAFELAARDDVKAAAGLDKYLQDAK